MRCSDNAAGLSWSSGQDGNGSTVELVPGQVDRWEITMSAILQR